MHLPMDLDIQPSIKCLLSWVNLKVRGIYTEDSATVVVNASGAVHGSGANENASLEREA